MHGLQGVSDAIVTDKSTLDRVASGVFDPLATEFLETLVAGLGGWRSQDQGGKGQIEDRRELHFVEIGVGVEVGVKV